VASNLSRFRRWAKRLVEAIITRQKMEITIQTEQVLLVQRSRFRRVWCQHCDREVDAVRLRRTGSFPNLQPALKGNSESDGWHFCAGMGEETLICLESIKGEIL